MRHRGRDPSMDEAVDDVLDAITANSIIMHREAQQMAVHHQRLSEIAEDTKALVERLREGLNGTD